MSALSDYKMANLNDVTEALSPAAEARLNLLISEFYEEGYVAIQRQCIKMGFDLPFEFSGNMPKEAQLAFASFVAYLVRHTGVLES